MNRLVLRKSVWNVKMLLVVAVSFAILVSPLVTNGMVEAFFKNGSVNVDLISLQAYPFALSSFVIFAGMFPGIPYAYSYLEERSSGYLKFIRLRMSRKKYAFQKIFYSGLSGGLSMLIPGILIFALVDIMGVDTTPEQYPTVCDSMIWAPYLFIAGGRLILALKAILLFLFGVMWSEFSLLISQLVRNRYAAFVLPFIIFEMLWLIAGGSIFNPIFLIRGDFENTYPLCTPYVVDIFYITVLVILNFSLLTRRKGFGNGGLG